MKEYIKDGLIIRYSDFKIIDNYCCPVLSNDLIEDLYFCYKITIEIFDEIASNGNVILCTKKELFSSIVYDNPKVHLISSAIDEIINEPCCIVIEKTNNDYYEKVVKYNYKEIDDLCNVDYWCKLYRYDYYIKKDYELKYTLTTIYSLIIGEGSSNVFYTHKKDHGLSIYLNELTNCDLIKFKKILDEFIMEGISLATELN